MSSTVCPQLTRQGNGSSKGADGVAKGHAFGLTRSFYEDRAVYGVMRLRWMAGVMVELEFARIVDSDFLYAGASVVFVTGYIFIHIGSGFLTFVSIMQIIFSLPFAYMFYYHVFGITFFTQLHILVVFLSLGVGADDVFVFMDCWNQCMVDPALRGRYVRLPFQLPPSLSLFTSCN